MDFDFLPEQSAILEMAAGFALRELAPHSLRWDEAKHFPVETLRKAGELGMGGICVAEDVGGTGLGRLDSVLIIEALATGSRPSWRWREKISSRPTLPHTRGRCLHPTIA